MRRLAAILVLCAAGLTHAISYTVQVAAVSDQESALSLVRNLLRDGYPAYFVRTTTEAGFVFRIRVGAFQNRGAALMYAESMPAVAGARPIPALAEAIPAGIMPLAPALLLSASLDGVAAEVVPWGEGIAFRAQSRDPLEQATYTLLGTPEPITFRAWRAAPADDGAALRMRTLRLWPDATAEGEDTPAVRDEFAVQLRRLIATQLGVEDAVVEAAAFTTADGAPALLVVERFLPGQPDSEELLGLADGASGPGPYGVDELVVGEDVAPEHPEPLLAFGLGRGPTADPEAPVAGAGWEAERDGPFTRLHLDGSSWRAAVGVPLWASGDLLITQDEGMLLFYRFDRRPLGDTE